NYLLLLGNKTPCEIFSIDEAATWFDIKNLSKSPAKFDEDKLAQINREHIKRADDKTLLELGLEPNLARFYTQEASLIPQIKAKINAIFAPKQIPDEWQESANLFKSEILKMPNLAPNFKEFSSNLMTQTNLKGKNFFMPLRFLLTNEAHGPELSELYPLIKDKIKEIIK
nr:glutamate--tRNA ligase [Campylobacter sp.]